jgi:metal-sulfur cluster biosynthetic enzyme
MSSESDPQLDPELDHGASPCQYTDYSRGTDPEELPATGEDATGLEADVWEALYEVDDPEMPVSVVDLGLIYGVEVASAETEHEGAHVLVEMTLTYSGCPARDMLLGEVRTAVKEVSGVAEAEVRLVWSPEWSVDMVTEAGREALNEFGLSL